MVDTAIDVAAPSDEDHALLARLRAGDDDAFAALIRSHGPRLLAVARRYVASEDAAQDCVQEAFIAAFRALDRFEGRSSLATWLHRITVNAALQSLRRKGGREEISIDEWLPSFDEDGFLEGPSTMTAIDAEALLEEADMRAQVRAAIDRLPADYRNILLLRDIEGLSIKEAALMLEITETNAKVRLHRARHALKGQLQPMLSAGAL